MLATRVERGREKGRASNSFVLYIVQKMCCFSGEGDEERQFYSLKGVGGYFVVDLVIWSRAAKMRIISMTMFMIIISHVNNPL